MKILAAAGGTAGHVNPMLATAHELADRGHDVIAIGTTTGLEADLVPAAGLELVTIDKVPMPRSLSMDLVRLPGRLKANVAKIRSAMEHTHADLMLGFGGYVSAPAYVAARNRIPVVVQEQNARPGMANKLGARWAHGVALTFEQTPLAAKKGITRVTGLPLRDDIARLAQVRRDETARAEARAQAARFYGLDPAEPIILVTGGSSGAQRLNETVSHIAEDLTGHAQVLHITGKGKLSDLAPGAVSTRYVAAEYEMDMARAYAAADIVVSRSGAGMVAELAALALPALVVPLPIGNGEQYLNAKTYIDDGGFSHLDNAEFTPDRAKAAITELLANRDKKRQILLSAGVSDGARQLANLIEEVA